MNISALKNIDFFTKYSDIPEINFLEQTSLSLTLNRGFAELYKEQPENPVLFLGKWLKKESKANEWNLKFKEEEMKKMKLQSKLIQLEKEQVVQRQKKDETLKVFDDRKEALIKQIQECTDFWKDFNNICETFKNIVGATGVYIALYDLKRRSVSEDDDETGHIHPSNTKVIRYISWCDDHSFLHGKFLDTNQGVTYTLYTPAQEINVQDPNNENQQNNNENAQQSVQEGATQIKIVDTPKEGEIKAVYIEDVVVEPKIRFYREPRWGCYLALDITYKTSLSYPSLLSAIQASKEYKENKEKQEERYKEWKEQREKIEKEIEELVKIKEDSEKELQEQAADQEEQDQGEQQPPKEVQPVKQPEQPAQADPNANQENELTTLKNLLTDWKEEPVKMKEYVTEEKRLILALDTLGQDRTFTKEEYDYIQLTAKTIKISIEELEKRKLEKDRDIRIQFNEDETSIKTDEKFSDDKFEANAQAAIHSYFISEEFKSKNITDENLKAMEGDIVRSKYFNEMILNGKVFDILSTFSQFEFVEHSKIFQNLFYFAHINPLDINEDETNKLEWEKAKVLWKNVFIYISSYNPIGPKPEQVKNIYKLNKIKENLESSIKNRIDVQEYSYTLLWLIDYILLIIKIRHDDIVTRTNNVLVWKEEREKIIQANNEIEEERKKIIEQAKSIIPEPQPVVEGQEGQVPQNVEQQQPPQGQVEGQVQPQIDEGEPFNLEEVLQKFDEEHPQQEVPPDVEFD
ncbi:MAG: NDKH5 family protein, partial [Mycoplasma sp.]